MKSKKHVDTAPSKVPIADLLAQTSERIAPLAHLATEKFVPLTQTATATVLPLAGQAVTFAAPYAQQAREAVTPYAHQAAEAVSPYAQTVAHKVAPYAEVAVGRIAPIAAGGALAAHEAVDKLGPVVEAARDRVTDELLPKISTALSAAAASPVAVEASRRGRAAYAAARGELSLPEDEPKRGGSWLKRLAVVAAVGGVVALVARRFLSGGKDSGWQAARPSAPYAPSTPPRRAEADAAAVATEDLSTAGPADATEPDAPETTSATDAADDGAGSSDGADVGTLETDVVPEAEVAPDPMPGIDNPTPYGPGSYVGSEPPEGYTVKGNENSMKFHLPGGQGYDQTQAEVWFDSEEAAERAGFVRAQG